MPRQFTLLAYRNGQVKVAEIVNEGDTFTKVMVLGQRNSQFVFFTDPNKKIFDDATTAVMWALAAKENFRIETNLKQRKKK